MIPEASGRSRPLSRRAVLLTPLALAGCETIEGWFTTKKTPLPGTREPLATQAPTTVLGTAAPAVAQGFVIAGFGSGEIAALRVESGTAIWTDGLGVAQGPSTLVEFLAIRDRKSTRLNSSHIPCSRC